MRGLKLRTLSLFLALLIAELAFCYPQTIMHGYKTCVSCHVSTDGGDVLSDYGRAMTEQFMATFANEGEAREFLGLGSAKAIDLGLDYRNLRIQTNGKSDQFPMYSVAAMAVRYHGITAFGSYGLYGRDRRPETRGYWIGYHGNASHNLDAKLGYFIPVVGLASNNHDLAIKKVNGLGREQERFVKQVQYRGPWIQVKYMMATEDLKVEGKNADNTVSQTGEKPPEYYVEARFNGVEGIDFGLHRRIVDGLVNFEGFSLRAGRRWFYVLAERDRQPLTDLRTDYARLGVFPFRGFDLWFEYQAVTARGTPIETRSYGYSWMIRPRLEFEGWLSVVQGQQIFMTSTKLWL